MPNDKRLYMTFPNDIHRHPKITRLPVEVRWAFIEMNGEARIADNDGIFPAADAEFTWGADILSALVNSHPTRPLVVRDGDTYVIRDYAEHQETREAREKRRATNAANGAKGGRPPKNPGVTEQKPNGLRVATESQANETQTKAESESESESEDFYSLTKSQSSSNRARVSTDAIEVSEMTRRLAAQQGITSLRAVIDAIHRHTSATVNADQAFQVSIWLLGKAKSTPAAPQRYVTGAIAKSPAEVEQHIFEAVA